MADPQTRARVEALRSEVEQHRYRYYVLSDPQVTDALGYPVCRITARWRGAPAMGGRATAILAPARRRWRAA
jgi:hypothetical protein